MNKKIRLILYLLISAVVVAIVVFFSLRLYKGVKDKPNDSYRYIPEDAALILTVNNPLENYRTLAQQSNVFAFLKSTAIFESALTFADSIYGWLQPKLNDFDQPQKVSFHLSLHNGDSSLSYLFVINGNDNYKIIRDIFYKKYKGNITTSLDAEGETIETITKNNKTFNVCFLNDVMLIGSNAEILKSSIKHAKSTTSAFDAEFAKVNQTVSPNAQANLFVNFDKAGKVFSTWFSELPKQISLVRNFKGWMGFDINFDANSCYFSGFTGCSPGDSTLVSAFSGQQALKKELFYYLSSDVASLTYLRFSDFSKFQKKLFEISTLKGNSETSFIAQKIMAAVDAEIALVYLNSETGNEKANRSALMVQCKNAAALRDSIDLFSGNVGKDELNSNKTYRISYLKDSLVPFRILGKMAENTGSKYCTVLGNFLILSSSPSVLQKLLSDYINDQTLSKNIRFISFNESIPENFNMLTYINPSLFVSEITKSAKVQYRSSIEDFEKAFLKSFDFFALTLGNENQLTSINLIARSKGGVKTKTPSNPSQLWNFTLDAAVARKPYLVVNPATKEIEIFVQDEKNNIYLINNKGQLLWKINLQEPIISNIYQVDIFKNNKYQFLFNTRTKIHLIDRKGRNVDKFPIALKSPATNGIAVFDYSKTKDYRILFASEDLQIRNITLKGETPAGWNNYKATAVVSKPLLHLFSNKDYLVVADGNHTITFLDRKGNMVLSKKLSVPVSPENPLYSEANAVCYTDTNGVVNFLYPDGTQKSESFSQFSSAHFFAPINIAGDKQGEFLFVDKNRLTIFDKSKTPIIHYNFQGFINEAPIINFLSGNKILIGVHCAQTNELYALNHDGKLVKGFPMHGTSPFYIVELLKEKKWEIITEISGNTIVATVINP